MNKRTVFFLVIFIELLCGMVIQTAGEDDKLHRLAISRFSEEKYRRAALNALVRMEACMEERDGYSSDIAACSAPVEFLLKFVASPGERRIIAGRTMWELLKNNDTCAIELFFAAGFPVNSSFDSLSQENALLYAAREGFYDMVKIILENDGDTSAVTAEGFSPLHMAVHSGDIEIVKLILPFFPNIDLRSKAGTTPLALAVFYNYENIARYLIEHGADVNSRNVYGETPLHYCAMWGSLEFARFLIEHGARTDIRTTRGETPLERALANGNDRVAEYLKTISD